VNIYSYGMPLAAVCSRSARKGGGLSTIDCIESGDDLNPDLWFSRPC
jgi:hypothetical protein